MNWISKFIKPKIKSLFKKRTSKNEETLWTTCECKNLIYKEDLESTITEGMLKQGFARLNRNYKREIRSSDVDKTIERLFESFDNAQNVAKGKHYGMWRYGDIDSDEEGGI